jgi:hypothetical protein
MHRSRLAVVTLLFFVIGGQLGFAGEIKTPLPGGVKGFRGTLRGKVDGHVANRGGIRLRVSDILRTSKYSRAKAPEQAIGRTVHVFAAVDDQKEWLQHQLKFLDSLRVDDTISVDVFAETFAFTLNPQFPCNTKRTE